MDPGSQPGKKTHFWGLFRSGTRGENPKEQHIKRPRGKKKANPPPKKQNPPGCSINRKTAEGLKNEERTVQKGKKNEVHLRKTNMWRETDGHTPGGKEKRKKWVNFPRRGGKNRTESDREKSQK